MLGQLRAVGRAAVTSGHLLSQLRGALQGATALIETDASATKGYGPATSSSSVANSEQTSAPASASPLQENANSIPQHHLQHESPGGPMMPRPRPDVDPVRLLSGINLPAPSFMPRMITTSCGTHDQRSSYRDDDERAGPGPLSASSGAWSEGGSRRGRGYRGGDDDGDRRRWSDGGDGGGRHRHRRDGGSDAGAAGQWDERVVGGGAAATPGRQPDGGGRASRPRRGDDEGGFRSYSGGDRRGGGGGYHNRNRDGGDGDGGGYRDRDGGGGGRSDRSWQQPGQQRQQQQQQWSEEQGPRLNAFQQKARALQREGSQLGDQLRGASSWEQLERILESAPPYLLTEQQIIAAVVAYNQLMRKLRPATAAAAAAALAPHSISGAEDRSPDATAVTAAAAATAATAGGLPPSALTERLRAALADVAPSLRLREVSYVLFGMSDVPQGPHSLAGATAAGNALYGLLQRLEAALKEVSAKAAEAEVGGGGGGGRAQDVGRAGLDSILSYVCTSLRRLHVTTPSLYRAVAAVATPLLGRELSGTKLAVIVLAFAQAENPEPRFMEQALHAATRRVSLAQIDVPFYLASLLHAAGTAGLADPSVVQPLAERLVQLLREEAAQPAAEQQQRANGEKRDDDGSCSGGGGGGGSGGGGNRSAAVGLRDRDVIYVLQSCAALGLPGDSELVQVMLGEVRRNGRKWSLPRRLQAAQHLLALGVDVLVPAGAEAVLVTEGEVEEHLRRPELTVAEMLLVLRSVARMRDVAGGADGPAGPAPDVDGAAAADSAMAARHRMPSALATAVQLVDAAAPLMRHRYVATALAALTAAGAAVPPSLLSRAEQIYLAQGALVGGSLDTEQQQQQQLTSSGKSVAAEGDAVSARDLKTMCVAVGRVLAWQPDKAAAALLQADFVRHCRTAAMDATRFG